jgi:hypothetical protein
MHLAKRKSETCLPDQRSIRKYFVETDHVFIATATDFVNPKGKIRIGTRVYSGVGYVDPSYPDFIPCVCLTASTEYGKLGPYYLRVIDDGTEESGSLIENVWHSYKVLPHIPAVTRPVSRYNKNIAWRYDACVHVDNKLSPTSVKMEEWLKWHDKLAHNQEPIRYPFGWSPEIRSTTLGVVDPDTVYKYRKDNSVKVKVSELLGVADGRKRVYFRYYIPSVKLQPQWTKLKNMLDSGINLLIIDVDGPRQESLGYYKEKYGVGDDFIQQNTQLINEDTLRIMVNDTKHSCGHTYGLAASLLGMEHVMLS